MYYIYIESTLYRVLRPTLQVLLCMVVGSVLAGNMAELALQKKILFYCYESCLDISDACSQKAKESHERNRCAVKLVNCNFICRARPTKPPQE